MGRCLQSGDSDLPLERKWTLPKLASTGRLCGQAIKVTTVSWARFDVDDRLECENLHFSHSRKTEQLIVYAIGISDR